MRRLSLPETQRSSGTMPNVPVALAASRSTGTATRQIPLFCPLLAERPLTRVVWIARPIVEVAKSMKAAKMPFTEQSARTLIALRDTHRDHFDLIVEYQDLERMDACRCLWDFCLPDVPFDACRWGLFHS